MTILRLSQVIHVTSLARSTIYKLMSSGLFPKPISLSERTVGWVEAEVDQWIDSLTDGCRFRHQIAQY
nr:AlpA family transcriptional regulator [Marinobacter subterrani]